MSYTIKDAKLRHINVEKHAYTLIKVVQKFRYYILRNKVIVVVRDTSVKTLLMQNEIGDRRAKWITILQQFDIDIMPMELVRGKGIVQAIAKIDPHLVSQQYVLYEINQEDWYKDIMHLLVIGHCTGHMNISQRKELKVKAQNYMLKNGNMFCNDHARVYLRCVMKEESQKFLYEFHDKF